MTIPIRYRKASPQNITSYDFFDLISGRAYKTFYPVIASSGAIASNAIGQLLTVQIDSLDTSMGCYTALTNSNAGETVINQDFDIIIKRPCIVDGDATASYTAGFFQNGGAVIDASYAVTISKVSSSVNSGLITVDQKLSSVGAGTGKKSRRIESKLTIPRTKLKGGDTLRMNITVKTITGTAGESMGLFTDPNNRSPTTGITNAFTIWDTVARTDFLLSIPFVPVS